MRFTYKTSRLCQFLGHYRVQSTSFPDSQRLNIRSYIRPTNKINTKTFVSISLCIFLTHIICLKNRKWLQHIISFLFKKNMRIWDLQWKQWKMKLKIWGVFYFFFTYSILKSSRIINSGIKEGEFNFVQYIFIYRVICACKFGNIMLTIVKFTFFSTCMYYNKI